jgi:hypothetical protein
MLMAFVRVAQFVLVKAQNREIFSTLSFIRGGVWNFCAN